MSYMEDISLDDNCLKIFSNDDEKMQKVGQILSSPKSRKIYGLLIDTELNAKEVGKLVDNNENPRLPNLIFHLDKMVDAGLLNVEKKMQRKRGHVLKYYKAVPFILIVPPQHIEKAQSSKTLKNTFKTVFKFGMIGVAAILTHAYFNIPVPDAVDGLVDNINKTTPIIYTALVLAAGLTIERIYTYFKKRRKQKINLSTTNFHFSTMENTSSPSA